MLNSQRPRCSTPPPYSEVSTKTEETDRGIKEQFVIMILVGALVGAGLVGVGVFVGIIIAKKKN